MLKMNLKFVVHLHVQRESSGQSENVLRAYCLYRVILLSRDVRFSREQLEKVFFFKKYGTDTN